MQKKKIVAGITAIVVLALLFAGVGYAFSGSARTYNQGDEQTLAYMSVTPADFNPIFTGDTIFDSYVYCEDPSAEPLEIKTAYAFKAASTPVTVPGQPAVTYTALQLGSKNMTVLNNTGEGLTALTFNVTATSAIGTTDFVYIFKLSVANAYQVATVWADGTTYYNLVDGAFVEKAYADADAFDADQNAKYTNGPSVAYLIYNGSGVTKSANLAGVILDKGNEVVAVTVYVAYIPNVYVPNDYIGPAADNADGYARAAYWENGETYYSDKNGTEVNPQPTAESDFGTNTYYKKYTNPLPYIQTANAPVDLAKTSFSIEVVDGSA